MAQAAGLERFGYAADFWECRACRQRSVLPVDSLEQRNRAEGFAAKLGLGIVNAGGLNEVRAQYSGFFLAVAAVCIASLCGLLSRQISLVVMVAVYGGLLAGRLVSLALNAGVGGYGPIILALYAIDALGLLLAATSLILDHRRTA
jgi:hypothetical protein